MAWGPCYGYVRCPDCGLGVPTAQLAADEHECQWASLLSYQATLLERDLEDRDGWENLTTQFLRYIADR